MFIATVLYYLAGAILLIVLYDYFKGLKYAVKAKAKGYKLPDITFNEPLGLGNIFAVIRAITTYHFHDLLFNIWRPAWGNNCLHTQLRHFVLSFDIMTKDPENIQTVLSGATFKDFNLGLRNHQLRPFLRHGIFAIDGEEWKVSRKFLRPMFSKEQIARLRILDQHVETLINIIKTKCATSPDSVVNVLELFHQLTTDTITHATFGESVESLSMDVKYVDTTMGSLPSSTVTKAILAGTEFAANRSRSDQYYWLFRPNSEQKQGIKIFYAFIDACIEKALAREARNKEKNHQEDEEDIESAVLVNQMVKETIDPIFIRDQMASVIFAGRDTTASFLSYTFCELVRDPRVYQKLRENVLNDFGTTSETLTFESLKRCTYLNWVINEVLRLHPAVPLNYRCATRDTQIPRGGGPDGDQPIFVQKGQKVMYSVYAMHRDLEIWGEDAEEFKPERWDPETARPRHAWSYLPFNGGPRICLGQQFALIEGAYAIVRMVQTFSNVSASKQELSQGILEEYNLTIRPRTGINMHFTQ